MQQQGSLALLQHQMNWWAIHTGEFSGHFNIDHFEKVLEAKIEKKNIKMSQLLLDNPSLLAEKRNCDLCLIPHYIVDMIPCPEHKNSFYCPTCVNDGDVGSYLKRMLGYKKEDVVKFLNSIIL